MQKVSNHLCINTYTTYVLPVRKNDFGSFLELVTYSYTQVLVSGDPKVSVTLAALVSFFCFLHFKIFFVIVLAAHDSC